MLWKFDQLQVARKELAKAGTITPSVIENEVREDISQR
jgi:hypothetical protein